MGLFSPRTETITASRSNPDGSGPSRSNWLAGSRSSNNLPHDAYISSHAYDYSSYSPQASSSRARSSTQESEPRSSTDRATITLAQRLEELAVSNADGLLGDDEYRLLRQNLFERFGAGRQIPAESPLVRLSPPDAPESPTTPSMTVGANFRVSRPPSVLSNASRVSTITSALKNVFRGSPSRASQTYDLDRPDDADDVSMTSGPSSLMKSKKFLRYQSSISSMSSQSHKKGNAHTYPSRTHQALDTRSISSQKTGLSSRTGRTSGSKGGASGPPSSYTPRKRRIAPLEFDGEGDDSISSAEIRAEIRAVEEEKNQLMENFTGLELSMVTRNQGSSGSSGSPRAARRTASSPADRPSSLWTVTPESVSPSVGGGAGAHRPPPPPLPATPPIHKMVPMPPKTGPSIIERKKSLGLLSTATAKFTKTRDQLSALGSSNSNSNSQSTASASTDSPSPSSKPAKTGFFSRRRSSQVPSSSSPNSDSASTSTPNLTSSSSSAIPPPATSYSSSSPAIAQITTATPMLRSSSSPLSSSQSPRTPQSLVSSPTKPSSPLGLGLGPAASLEEQTALANIRRRKEDTARRYDQRLEFLRAKLRGAEIRERLLR